MGGEKEKLKLGIQKQTKKQKSKNKSKALDVKDIDELFDSINKSKKDQSAAVLQQEAPVTQQPKSEKGTVEDLFGTSKQKRKRTEEGYKIYSEEELGLLQKGGYTDKCPFDCHCCF